MRIGDQLWLGEPGEPPLPKVDLGYSALDPCDRCGQSGDNAWISTDYRSTEFLFDLYLCRMCLTEAIRRTYEGGIVPTVAKPDRTKAPGQRGRPRRAKLSYQMRFIVMKRDRYRCQMCGISAPEGAQLDIDHRIPLAEGGSNDIANLWVLCSPCNSGKGVLDL